MSKADLNKQPNEVAAMFDAVAPTYDRTNDVLSLGQDRIWRTKVRAAVAAASGQSILDLAAGTGTSSVSFLKPGVRVVASDFSEGMLAEGRKRHPQIEFVYADATNLPFKDAEFHATTISFGLRNVVDVPKALREMYRVTKPGGRLVICEFSKVVPALRPFYALYLKVVMPIVAKLASVNPAAYDYLGDSIAAWPNQESLAELIRGAGFANVNYKNLSFGVVAIHIGIKAGA
ncbi:MAG: bifunctional demethylmenaquinone methyltransferase/2-methoxy-6-polyprenyl-1,4-benzoquinol methylase UbiE [Micrococcales bacterium]